MRGFHKTWFFGLGLAAFVASIPKFTPLLFPEASFGSATATCMVLFGFCLLIELSLYAGVTRKGWVESLEAIAPAFLPALFLLGGWRWLPLHGLEPQDFPLRKAEIVTGVVWVAHLSWFVSVLTAGALQKGRRSPVWTFGLAGLVLFAGATLHTVRCELSGDEPHYLLMTHSLWQDGDLDLSNNYAFGDANAFYGRGVLEPQGNEHLLKDGRRYSHHALGAPLLLYPGYVLAGRLGAALTESLCAAGTLAWTLAALAAMGYRRGIVVRVGWVGLLASPLLLYSGLLFAEIPSALVCSGLLWAAAEKRWGWVGLGLGLLPWMHNRNVLLMVPFIVFIIWVWRQYWVRKATTACFLLGLGVPLALLGLFFVELYGVWTPLGAHNESFSSLFPLERFPIDFFGLLVDQETGLWLYFPIFALLPAGMILGWKRRGILFQAVAGSVLFYYFAMCFYQNLGLQPAARYWTSLTPFLLLLVTPALQALDYKSESWKRGVGVLFGVTVLLGIVFAAVPWLRYSKLQGEAWVLVLARKFTGMPWPDWAPSFHASSVDLRSYGLSVFWFAVVTGVTVQYLKDRRRGR